MSAVFLIALSLHVLAAIFWAGTSFTLARTGGLGIEKLRVPQLGAALVAVLSGGYLGHAAHADAFTRVQQVLMVGAASALLAAVLQVAAAMLARRSSSGGFGLVAQRAAAALLAGTALCMVLARYA
jgi:hypothetical protein